MSIGDIYVGNTALHVEEKSVALHKVTIGADAYYKMENYDQIDPFLMTIVSDTDMWMYISSTGGLTCGRKNADSSLFPYYTDDKIHDSRDTTGPKTHIILTKDGKNSLWIPFMEEQKGMYKVTRNLYKSILGNKIMFEEVNHDLGVSVRYSWNYSSTYGFVREASINSHKEEKIKVRLLDGIRNILPYGITSISQTMNSTLLDGYKRCELDETGIGIYTLSSRLTDKAEPSESLKATTVWSYGFDDGKYLLSEKQVPSFCATGEVTKESDVKGKRGAYYLHTRFTLDGKKSRKWYIVAQVNQSATKIEKLKKEWNTPKKLVEKVEADIKKGDKNLKQYVAEADGIQCVGNERNESRHFSNTLFNIMRGGLYADGYRIAISDIKEFMKTWNKPAREEIDMFLHPFSEQALYGEILEKAKEQNNPVIKRLVMEYLPLTYSRRHGDPSRPWNTFNIDVKKADGTRKLQFEGNWRDIFQNWEALSIAYPEYIEGIISKFVNASTTDGYNPYRITKDGIDWEVLDPQEPWSNIGYWGDHQLIYLLKLLELSKKYNTDKLDTLLEEEIFVYGNVPYKIVGIEKLIKNPRNSIIYDIEEEKRIQQRVETYGADGKLVFVQGEIYRVNLMEKLLVTLLTKLSNYVPEGGIWMNTQRPEWNDANNALVGYGLSMVTLYYAHRFLLFMEEILETTYIIESKVSQEVYTLFLAIKKELEEKEKLIGKDISDSERYEIIMNLGIAGEKYRKATYKGFTGKKKTLEKETLQEFFGIARKHIKDTIYKNKREDKLYHSYNVITFKGETANISHLYEMLEGQVGVLSAKAISLKEGQEVIDALKESKMYREDQKSYMLYPFKRLPNFLEKNRIDEKKMMSSSFLQKELQKNTSGIIEKDIQGNYRFNGKYRNGEEIKVAMEALGEYTEEECKEVEEIFTETFRHHEFTGRSGTFYKYEGLGCIYWHMVSKLVLAIQELVIEAYEKESEVAPRLEASYREVKAGIGVEKKPEEYGAFPTDPYSHTPSFTGVQQPGMTGQVKEDLLIRFAELGVKVKKGKLFIQPYVLNKEEFLQEDRTWKLYPKEGIREICLHKNELGFTYCSVPFIYKKIDVENIYDKEENKQAITIFYNNGKVERREGRLALSYEESQHVFQRDGKINKIVVEIFI